MKIMPHLAERKDGEHQLEEQASQDRTTEGGRHHQ